MSLGLPLILGAVYRFLETQGMCWLAVSNTSAPVLPNDASAWGGWRASGTAGLTWLCPLSPALLRWPYDTVLELLTN